MRKLIGIFIVVSLFNNCHSQSVKDYMINGCIEHDISDLNLGEYLNQTNLPELKHTVEVCVTADNFIAGIIYYNKNADAPDHELDTSLFLFDKYLNQFYVLVLYPDWEGEFFRDRLDNVSYIYKLNKEHKLEYILHINIFEEKEYILTKIKAEENKYLQCSMKHTSQANLNQLLDYDLDELINLLNELSQEKQVCMSWEITDLSEFEDISYLMNDSNW